MRKVMVFFFLVSLLLSGSAYAVEVLNGATWIVGNDIDAIVDPNSPGVLDPNLVMAINCGRGVTSGNPTGNPYASNDGFLWGNLDAGDFDLVVNGITFYNDMWNTNDEARNWNKDGANVGSDRDVFGDEDDWRFRVERGALYHGIGGGSDDGGIPWLGNHLGGRQDDGRTPPRNQPEWQCGYEGTHDHNPIALTGADPTSIANFSKILRRAGAQNTGKYEAAKGQSERDMVFDFAVKSGHLYNVIAVPYKNNGENTNTRIEINGVMVLDNFYVNADIDKNVEFGAVSSDVITDPSQTVLTVIVGRGSNNNEHDVQDINLIIVHDLGEVTNFPPVPNAGPDAYTWFDGGVAEQILAGSATDPESDAMTYKWLSVAGVTFVNDEDPATTAQFAASGVYTLTLEVKDPLYTRTDTVVITVDDDACASTKTQGIGRENSDINDDCVTDLADLAFIAEDWLKSTAQTK